MTDDKLLTVKEAAALLDYNPSYFRQVFLDREHPLLQVVCMPGAPGARKRRKIRVKESEIRKILNGG